MDGVDSLVPSSRVLLVEFDETGRPSSPTGVDSGEGSGLLLDVESEQRNGSSDSDPSCTSSSDVSDPSADGLYCSHTLQSIFRYCLQSFSSPPVRNDFLV